VFDRTVLLERAFSQHDDEIGLVTMAFLAAYQNANTRSAYILDLKIFFGWCKAHDLNPLQAKRAHLQAYISHLATNGSSRPNSPKTIDRRIGTIRGWYRTAVLDDILEHDPSQHLRLPKVIEDPSKITWLTRWELGALMHAAEGSWRRSDWALVTLLGVMGMRVSAACGIDLADLGSTPTGYRNFRSVGKGGVISVKILPIPTWPAIDRAAGKRSRGPLLLRPDGKQMTRRSAAGVLDGLCKQAGITRHVNPHALRHSFVTLALDAGVPLEVVSRDVDHARPSTTEHYRRTAIADHARAAHTVAALVSSVS
jgi:integrase/recombinase XerD